MAYRLKAGESVQNGIRRVISEQIEKALDEITDRDLDRAETIHQVRKRCKKIRGSLRLARGALGNRYSEENAWYRDTARHVSDLRDAQAMIETCDKLSGRFVDSVDEGVLRPTREVLEERKNALMGDTDHVDDLLQDLRSAMLAGQKRVASLVLAGDGCRAAILNHPESFAKAESLMPFLRLAEQRIAQMERDSGPLGGRLFAEKPKHLARRFAVYFRLWSEDD